MRLRLLFSAAVTALLIDALTAATFNVDSTADEVDANPGNGACATAGGTCTLRAAVMEANALAGDDDVLIAAGTYVLSIAPGAGGDADGDLDVSDNLTVTGAGTATTSVDASAMNRMFLVSTGVELSLASMTLDPADHTVNGQIGQLVEGQDGSTLVLHDLTILPYNGNGSSNSLIRHTGVGLSVTSVSWSIDTAVTFFMDLEPAGGPAAIVTLDDVSVEVLAGAGRAPGLRLVGAIPTAFDVTNSRFDASALVTSSGSQDAIDTSGGAASVEVTITDSEIIDWPSTALDAGSSGSGERNVDVVRTTLTNLNGTLLQSSVTSGSLDVQDSLLSTGESAFQIFNAVPSILRNSTIIVDGGQGFFENGVGALYNSTLIARVLDQVGPVMLRNSVMTGPCLSGASVASEGYNLIADTTNCTITGDSTGNILNVDPELDILADNGGPTETMHPLAGSPLLDAGNPATPGSGGTACEAADQRGIARPQDGTGDTTAVCDIGAVESMGVPDPVFDFGDAPWPYPTLEADDGARHRVSTLFLGTGVSVEEDGLPDADAEGDNLDDGLNFLEPFVPGSMSEVEVTVSEAADLEIWWDFGQDGTWDDPGDQQPVQQSIGAGTSSFFIDVPDFAATGDVFVRARVSSALTNPTGSAPSGEVEDYKITVLEPPFVRAHAGPFRDVALGGSVIIGGDPAADGGIPPYSYSWSLDGPHVSLDSSTAANPVAIATSEGDLEACLDVTDAQPTMDEDCIEIFVFCADPINQDPAFTEDSGAVDYWGANSVESEEYAVMFGGDVIFHSGDKVVLGDGFKIEAGARFAVDIDPDINAGCGESSTVSRTVGER